MLIPRTTDDDITKSPTHRPVTDDDFTRRPRPSDSTHLSGCACRWSMLKVKGRRGRRMCLRCYYPMLRLKFDGFEVPNADNAVSKSKVSFVGYALFCKKRGGEHVMYIPDEGQCYCSNEVARRGEERSDTLYHKYMNAKRPTHFPQTTNGDFTRHATSGPTRGSRTDDKR